MFYNIYISAAFPKLLYHIRFFPPEYFYIDPYYTSLDTPSLSKSQLAHRSGVSYTDTGTPGFLLPSSILQVSIWDLLTRVVEFKGWNTIKIHIGPGSPKTKLCPLVLGNHLFGSS